MASHICRYCKQEFELIPLQVDLLKRFDVPDPQACPDCRLQRRYAFRNERVLYQRKCDLTGQPIIAIFPEGSPYTIYSQDAWWSDQWNQLEHGQEMDFTRPFFDQLKELQLKQPRLPLLAKDSENSEYTNHSARNRDCYLGVSIVNCEKVFYGYTNFDSNYIVDSSYIYDHSELCYECFYCHQCYRCGYATLCRGCTDVWFSFDLSGCESCFLSWNLRNKKYCFMNEQLTKEEYEAKVDQYKNMTHEQQKALIETWQDIMATQAIHQATVQVNSSDSTGNYLTSSYNVQEGYYVSEAENSAFVMHLEKVKDCLDCCNSAPAEFCYEMTGVINNNNCKFMNYSYDNSFVEYGDHVFNSQNLFGCVGLNKQKFCILNKQYSESDYKQLREKIIEHMKQTGEWGEFFPFSYSPFPYNETMANDLFPRTKAQAAELGATWNDELDPEKVASRPFTIQADEAVIYKQLSVPEPVEHPEARFRARMKQRTLPKIYDRNCAKCQKPVQSSFAPDRTEIIYCETCYKEAIY